MNILEQIISVKKAEVAKRKSLQPEYKLKQKHLFHKNLFSLMQNLKTGNSGGIIAEFKRRSPSKGMINKNADVLKTTMDYTKYGASGLSILTDSFFFGGHSSDLEMARFNRVPILRKDFIVDAYQVIETKAMGADVLLLIAACLTVDEVKQFASLAKEVGLEILLEIHSEKEVNHICDEIDIVGINNRNLENFKVDINNALLLSKLIPPGKVIIAESGIDQVNTIVQLKEAGLKGFLIGEKFMKEDDPGKAFKDFHDLLNAEFEK